MPLPRHKRWQRQQLLLPLGEQVAESESRAAALHNSWCPPSPLPRQLEDLGQWAGPAGMALLAELQDKEGTHCEELRSGPSTEWAEDNDTDLSSCIEEDSISGSLLSDAWPEDTDPNRMAGEESNLVSVPHEAWAENKDLRQNSEEESISCSLSQVKWGEDPEDLSSSSEEESTSGSLPCKSWAEDQDLSCSREKESTSGSSLCESQAESSEVCTDAESGVDQPQEDLICPYHMKPMRFYMGTGMESEEESLPQMEDAGQDFRELEAAMGTIWREEELLKWDRRTFERLRGLHSVAAEPVPRLSCFRRVLRALRRAFRGLRRLIPVLIAPCCQ